VIVPLVVWLVVVLLVTLGLFWNERTTKMEDEQRFDLRTRIAGRFVETYVADITERERAQAREFLSAPEVSEQEFKQSVDAFGYQAAVLLDDRGRVLQVAPAKPELLGTDLTGKYEHLRRAVAGQVAISPAVPSAAEGVPIAAFAVPFDTPQGRRVFSGAYEIRTTPIAYYVRNAFTTSTATALIDNSGTILASNDSSAATGLSKLATTAPGLAAAIGSGEKGTYEEAGVSRRFVTVEAAGTPWRLVASMPESELYVTLNRSHQLSLWVFFGLSSLGLLFALVVIKHLQSRRRFRSVLVDHANALEGANAELGEANRLKGDLVAMLSHDAGQPLTSIMGYAELLTDNWERMPDEQRRDCLAKVEHHSHQLNQLVSGVLTMCQADVGALQPRRAAVDIREAIGRAVADAGATDRELAVGEIPESAAFVDPGHLQQILGNLLTNAVKYGAGAITTGSRVCEDDPSCLEVFVTDEGSGVPPAFVERLFDRYARAETDSVAQEKGTGLGLYIVDQLVRANGGTVRYEQASTGGACFIVRLPAHAYLPVHARA